MSLHMTDFEVNEAFTANHAETIIADNKDRIGFYLWELYGLGDKALLVFGFPKQNKDQRIENSSSYLYAVERVRNKEDLDLALEKHGSKIGFYIFKNCYIPEYNEWWFIMAWTNPKIFEDLKARDDAQKLEGKKLEAERKEKEAKT